MLLLNFRFTFRTCFGVCDEDFLRAMLIPVILSNWDVDTLQGSNLAGNQVDFLVFV